MRATLAPDSVSVELLNPSTGDPPVGQYSQLAIVPSGATIVHVAGQLPLDQTGELVASDFEGQAEHVFAALARLLEAAGSSMSQIAFLRTYIAEPTDYAEFREVRKRSFERYGVLVPPAATTIVVASLVGGSLIELDATAVRNT